MVKVSMFVSSGTNSVPTEAASVIVNLTASISVVASPSSVIAPSADSVTLPFTARRLALSAISSPDVTLIRLAASAVTSTVSSMLTRPPDDASDTLEPAAALTATPTGAFSSRTVRSPTAVMSTSSTLRTLIRRRSPAFVITVSPLTVSTIKSLTSRCRSIAGPVPGGVPVSELSAFRIVNLLARTKLSALTAL